MENTELKEELAVEYNGILAAVSMRSKCGTIEVVIGKPENWTTMNVLEKKHFIVNFFVEKDFIKVLVSDSKLD
jgi:hypothetical protein